MKRTVTLAILVLFIALLACNKKEPVTAQVQCRYANQFVCDIQTTGELGKKYSVCWDIDVTCGDGQKLAANTCMDVSGKGKATSAVPNDRFTGGTCRTGAVTGVAVNNVAIRDAR